MFIGDEVVLHVSFTAAKARLANLARGGLLASASADAYDNGISGLVRVGLLSSAPDMSTLAEAHFLDLVSREDSALLALRWEAIGPGGRLFPALDADITLTPAGEHATLITLAGAYRPPPGPLGAGLDRAILRRVAAATIRTFVNRVADAIGHPAGGAGPGRGNARTEPSRLPPTA